MTGSVKKHYFVIGRHAADWEVVDFVGHEGALTPSSTPSNLTSLRFATRLCTQKVFVPGNADAHSGTN